MPSPAFLPIPLLPLLYRFFLYSYQGTYQQPVQCIGPSPMLVTPGQIVTIQINFYFQYACDEFLDNLAPIAAASGSLKMVVAQVMPWWSHAVDKRVEGEGRTSAMC